MFRSTRNPGDGLSKRDIYEVWGDVIEHASDLGPAIIEAIHTFLEAANVAECFNCQQEHTREDGRPFLSLHWGDFRADVDARPFGEHLDVYVILGLTRGLLDHPDPAARVAELEAWQRRDLQLFQTMIKRAVEEALEALDEGRL